MVLLEEDLRGKAALGEEVQRLKDVVRGEWGVGWGEFEREVGSWLMEMRFW
jgi:hypothetical protein